MAAATRTTQNALRYFLGTCLPSSKRNATKVRIPRLQFDEHINMHFRHYDIVYANDPNKLCKTGDVILIQTLPQKLTRLITHEVVRVIYPLGDITDPITGKKIVVSQYREDIDEKTNWFGKTESAFDYSKAPKRGRLENVQDFTHKKMYIKYYDNPEDPQSDTV